MFFKKCENKILERLIFIENKLDILSKNIQQLSSNNENTDLIYQSSTSSNEIKEFIKTYKEEFDNVVNTIEISQDISFLCLTTLINKNNALLETRINELNSTINQKFKNILLELLQDKLDNIESMLS